MGFKEHMDWLFSDWYGEKSSVEYYFPPKSLDDTNSPYDKYTVQYRGLTGLEAQCVVKTTKNGNGNEMLLIWFDVRIPEGMETLAKCYADASGPFGINGCYIEKIVRTPARGHAEMLVRIPPYKLKEIDKNDRMQGL